MKNKNLLTRSALSPLGGHKQLEQQNDVSSSTLPPTHLGHSTARKPSLHKPIMIAPDPEGSRYTLSLKIEKSVVEKIARMCGSSDLDSQPGAKRSLTMQFRAHLLTTPVERAMKSTLKSPTSLRLDIRLPESFVLQILEAEKAAPFEPRATTLARNLAPKLSSFLEELS